MDVTEDGWCVFVSTLNMGRGVRTHVCVVVGYRWLQVVIESGIPGNFFLPTHISKHTHNSTQ